MKNPIVIFWLWGFVLTAYVCYERFHFNSIHNVGTEKSYGKVTDPKFAEEKPNDQKTATLQSESQSPSQSQGWTSHNKLAD